MGKLRFLALCAAWALAMAQPASAITFQIVPGTSMEMEPPSDQCALQPSLNMYDANYFAALQQLHAGSNNLLAYFVPCDGLAVLRQGVAVPLAEWTAVLLPLSGGQVMPATGYTRARALDELAQVAATTDMQAFLDGRKESIENRVAEVLAQNAYQMKQVKSMGVMARDDAGIYSGALITQMLGGQTQNIAGVYGMTLINGYVITLNVFRPYESPETFSALVDAARAQTAALVVANGGEVAAAPAPAEPPAAHAPLAFSGADTDAAGDDAGKLLLVIGGGIAVIVIGGLVGFFLTRRKPG